jgi:hypothetical protein
VQRLFSGFPSGMAGIGLLVLRIVVATHLSSDALNPISSVFSTIDEKVISTPILRVVLLVLGGFALIGSLTPVIQATVALAELAAVMFHLWAPEISASSSVSVGCALTAAAVATSLVMLGPGGYSIDAYLFGRREISIPPVARPPAR